MDEKNIQQKIIIKNLCPMLAVISAGKTSILKVLFGIEFLTSSAGIGTKFVNIIRYNPEVGNEPIFYHLILRKTRDDEYEYYKDEPSEIIGKKEIEEKNRELNDEFKNKEIPMEDLFYMVEVGEANFIDKEYLKNYNLVDIPGVSEYLKSEKKEKIRKTFSSSIEAEMKDYNPDEEKSYLTEIFKIIKNKINNGIIVFSMDNYTQEENYRIIGKFQKVINKPIENFLILLNKIDLSENREEDINKLYSKITEYFPSMKDFNFTKNTLVPCSCIQLKNELKMENSFYHLIYFHYINYLMNSKQNKEKYKNINFIDFIIKFLNRKKISKKNLLQQVKKLINDKDYFNIINEIKHIFITIKNEHLADNLNLGIKEDDFEADEIKTNIENLEEEDDDEFNSNELEGNIYILYYYSQFKNKKLIPRKSLDTLKIMKYFTLENIKLKNEENKTKNEKKVLNEEIIISEKMNQIYTEYTNEENLKKYKKYLKLPSNILDTSKVIYIPLLGLSNAGKSTILNGLIGFNILPAKKTECTKKGILIRYWENDYPVIRKAKFIKNNNKYYFESEVETIANNIEDIQNILSGLNGKFTDNEEDFFYEININIKFIKDSDIDDSLKERICFIDLPGFGTNNKFEYLDTYSHIINMCHIFMYVVFNQKIKENDNHKMLNNMMKVKNIDSKEFINRCLFIINFDKDQDTSKQTLLEAKKDIIKVLPDLNESFINNINLCFFNAKYFENYVLKYKYYNSFQYLIKSEFDQYLRLQEQLSKGQIDSIKLGSFNKFFLNQLKENIKNDIKDKFIEKDIRLDKLLKEEIKSELTKYKVLINEKELELISKYISFSRQNLSKSDLLEKSNIEYIKMNIFLLLKNIKANEDTLLNNKINNISKQMFEYYEEINSGLNKYNLKRLKMYLNSSIGLLKSSKLFYIPIFGIKNSGKSTILNCLIGESLISTSNKFTKRGIIIKYWNKNYSVIRKNKFTNENSNYNFESEEEILAKGLDDIKIIIEGANDAYIQEDENVFYEIDTKIKFIDELKLDNNLKEKICFVDFPKDFDLLKYGNISYLDDIDSDNITIDDNGNAYKDLYYHLIGSCNIFFFVFYKFNKNEVEYKKAFNNLCDQIIQYRGISMEELINKFLFIVNYDEKDFKSKNPSFEYEQLKKDIYSMISCSGIYDIKNLSICFFNAKYYETYIFKLKYYGSTDYFVNYEYNEYLKEQKKFLSMFYYKSFDKYLIQKLYNTIKNDIAEKFIEDEVNLDEDILYSMRKTLKTQILLFNQKQFNLMIKYLTFGKEKICKTHYLHKSNIDEFIKNIFILILRTKRFEDEEINANFKNCFELFEELDSKEKNENRGNEDEEGEEEEEEGHDVKKENKYCKLWTEVNETLINENKKIIN